MRGPPQAFVCYDWIILAVIPLKVIWTVVILVALVASLDAG